MGHSPLIGITTYAANECAEVTLPENYISAVRNAGGTPVLIPPGESNIDSLLDKLDGLILAGGGDICPTIYGGETHESIYMVDEPRDQMEIELARRVVRSKMPVLAICRGMQIVNVALGGTLHAHLPDVVGESVLHRAPPRQPIAHEVQVEGTSKVATAMEEQQIQTMSWHHQSLDRIAEELAVVGRASDGVIEAVEMPGHDWLLSVQWHPELTASTDPTQQRLFDALVKWSVQTTR